MDGPYKFKNLENQGKNLETNTDPYFYDISAGQNDKKVYFFMLNDPCEKVLPLTLEASKNSSSALLCATST